MKIAVVGCGAVFEVFYLEALRRLHAQGVIEVAVLVDSQPANLQAASRHFPSAWTAADLGPALEMPVARALVLTPPASHGAIMLALARAGIHAYCEKPLAVSEDEARSIAEAFAGQGLLCKVGYVRRLFPNFQAFRHLYSGLGTWRDLSISDGEIFRWPIKTGSIFSPEQAGGGVVWDKLSHNLDMIQWIAGIKSIDQVRSNCRPGRVPTDVLVEGSTDHGTFRVAVSWTQGLANLVSARDGTSTIESRNGLMPWVSVPQVQQGQFSAEQAPASYGEAVECALTAFFGLRNADEPSLLAGAQDSVALTRFLSDIDRMARQQGAA